MTFLTIRRPPLVAEGRASGSSLLQSPLLLACFGVALTAASLTPMIAAVWSAGDFNNTDDAMRLVEVRDWLSGQPWFDLHQYRLDPPGGVMMHWTRVVDVPLAFLIKFLSLFGSTVAAERLTRIVFPLLFQFGLFLALVSLARKLCGPAAMLPALMIAALTGAMLAQFQPGRIHHHIPQILLVVLMLRATLDAVETSSWRRAAYAAMLAALSLSINIENIPYVLVEIAVFALVFVARGEAFRDALLGFALSLVGSSLIAFVATVGPERYLVGVCDAFSTAHLVAIFVGGAALAAMAAAAPRLDGVALRMAACAVGGALAIGALATFYPACLHDPQAGVDPLLRQYWLNDVGEARPLTAMILAKPINFFLFAFSALLGLAAACLAAWRERGPARVNWLIIAAFAAIGLITSAWQVRAVAGASAIALFGGVWVAAKTMDWASRQQSALAKLAPLMAILPFGSFFPAAIAAIVMTAPNIDKGKAECHSAAAIRLLDVLPKSILMAPIDFGSSILADSGHSVVAAPYHRNNHGNGELVRAMLATPTDARKIVENSGASYLIFCADMPEVLSYAAGNRDGLAAILLRGEAPDWLTPEPAPGAPFSVFKIR
jgi:hypothetical protein